MQAVQSGRIRSSVCSGCQPEKSPTVSLHLLLWVWEKKKQDSGRGQKLSSGFYPGPNLCSLLVCCLFCSTGPAACTCLGQVFLPVFTLCILFHAKFPCVMQKPSSRFPRASICALWIYYCIDNADYPRKWVDSDTKSDIKTAILKYKGENYVLLLFFMNRSFLSI